jgi:membrane protein implicated in regulation of membrane protease activity
MTRRQAWLIKAWAIWTLYVWGTRIWNIWQDGDNTLAFNIVHSVLALVSVVFAILGWRVVKRVRDRRREQESGSDTLLQPSGTR